MLLPINKLKLLPLNCDQLLLLSKSRHDLEMNLGLAISNLELNADEKFMEELNNFVTIDFIATVKQNEPNFGWYTHWLIIDNELNLIIGGIGANGLPDDNGKVMIGYYIDKKSEGKGCATEAVKQLLHWMKSTNLPNLKSVIADTLITSLGSQKVLLKNGFKFVGKVEEGYRWQFDF